MTAQSFDPRARVILYACFTTAVLLVNDLRALAAVALAGLVLLIAARVDWQKMRSLWIGVVVFIGVISIFNLLLRSPLEAAQQALRAVAMSSASLALILTFDPAQLGITFRRLGCPDKFAFVLDLTMRFVPTLMRDFRQTMDAQKARGYELETKERSLKALLTTGRRFVPLIVPVVVRAVLDAEDRANAMELRAFGTAKRTWIQQLHYRAQDFVMIAAGVLVLAGAIVTRYRLG
jgi:energy-coupling factor transport system permease protein